MGKCNYKNCHSPVDYYCAECRDGYCEDHGNWRNRRFLCLNCYDPDEDDEEEEEEDDDD